MASQSLSIIIFDKQTQNDIIDSLPGGVVTTHNRCLAHENSPPPATSNFLSNYHRSSQCGAPVCLSTVHLLRFRVFFLSQRHWSGAIMRVCLVRHPAVCHFRPDQDASVGTENANFKIKLTRLRPSTATAETIRLAFDQRLFYVYVELVGCWG